MHTLEMNQNSIHLFAPEIFIEDLLCTEDLEVKDVASTITRFIEGNSSENQCYTCALIDACSGCHQYARRSMGFSLELGKGRGKYQEVLAREVSAPVKSWAISRSKPG